MLWRIYSNGVLHVLIINIDMLSEKATNYLLGFPNVASKSFFDNILALWIRTGWTLVCMFHVHHKFDLNINFKI